jgi:hypothetical protein
MREGKWMEGESGKREDVLLGQASLVQRVNSDLVARLGNLNGTGELARLAVDLDASLKVLHLRRTEKEGGDEKERKEGRKNRER